MNLILQLEFHQVQVSSQRNHASAYRFPSGVARRLVLKSTSLGDLREKHEIWVPSSWWDSFFVWFKEQILPGTWWAKSLQEVETRSLSTHTQLLPASLAGQLVRCKPLPNLLGQHEVLHEQPSPAELSRYQGTDSITDTAGWLPIRLALSMGQPPDSACVQPGLLTPCSRTISPSPQQSSIVKKKKKNSCTL